MRAALKDKGRNDVTIVEKDCTDLSAIATYTEDLLMANPDISAFLCLNDKDVYKRQTFINAIFLYDDKMVITFNYKEGTKTITFAELQEAISDKNGSDLDCLAAPKRKT